MKLSDIKTEKEFWLVAENWYKRANILSDIWRDNSYDIKKRIKAFVLWNKMKDRIMRLVPIVIKISTPRERCKTELKVIDGFKKGFIEESKLKQIVEEGSEKILNIKQFEKLQAGGQNLLKTKPK